MAPSKWARRWAEARPEHPLELVPVDIAFGPGAALRTDAAEPPREEDADPACDVMLERALPGQRPDDSTVPEPAQELRSDLAPEPGSLEPPGAPAAPSRHAVHLYTERIALVLPADHEFADETSIDIADLGLVALLDHPNHAPDWPNAQPWADPSLMPGDVAGILDLVAAGLGGALLPLPLARHLTRKREHATLELTGAPSLAGTDVWATWAARRDGEDVQQLAGVLHGRTARSGRTTATTETPRTSQKPRAQQAAQKSARKPRLKPNSRGAQLAAAREKAERKKTEARRAKRGRRR